VRYPRPGGAPLRQIQCVWHPHEGHCRQVCQRRHECAADRYARGSMSVTGSASCRPLLLKLPVMSAPLFRSHSASCTVLQPRHRLAPNCMQRSVGCLSGSCWCSAQCPPRCKMTFVPGSAWLSSHSHHAAAGQAYFQQQMERHPKRHQRPPLCSSYFGVWTVRLQAWLQLRVRHCCSRLLQPLRRVVCPLQLRDWLARTCLHLVSMAHPILLVLDAAAVRCKGDNARPGHLPALRYGLHNNTSLPWHAWLSLTQSVCLHKCMSAVSLWCMSLHACRL